MGKKEVNDIERHLVFKIAGGLEKNLGYIYSLRCVSKRYLEILLYCNSKNILGKSFAQVFEDHEKSPVRVMSFFLRRISQDQNRRASGLDLR